MMKEGAGRAQRRMRGSLGMVPAISSTWDGGIRIDHDLKEM